MQLELGKTYHGFTVKRIAPVADQNATLYELLHTQSGAELIYMDREDSNKVFGVAFKTIPTDSTGVFHILEHCMLNGSEKFPLKEPFVNLLKSSMQTFLNAMTFPDKTVYPVASQNEKDFFNLMSVYLDAVFAPNLRTNREVFMQEGWHYEITQADAPLVYKGVVYNEMKGAMSSIDDVLQQATMTALFPDTCYRHNSGGDPEVIPELTYEQFLASYQKYYHADNAILFLYGTMDLDEKLAFIDKEYLSKYQNEGVEIGIDVQAPVINENYTCAYEIGETDSTEENTYMTRAYCVGSYRDQERLLALQVLNDALMSTNESPLKKALLAASLGKDVKGYLLDGIQQPIYSFELDKTEAPRKEEFCAVLDREIGRIVNEGIDREVLEASLNRMEFKLREMDTGALPKGLLYYFDILSSKLYGGKPELYLCYEETLKKLRAGLETGYFENVLRTCFLESDHKAAVVVTPSKELAGERQARAEQKAAQDKAKLTAEQLQALIEENETLLAHQSVPDSPEQIALLPTLKLSDLGEAPKEMGTECLDGMLYHAADTNGIVYLNYYFDIGGVAEEDLPYVSMLASVYGKLGTEQTPAHKLTNQIKLNFGDLQFAPMVVSRSDTACKAALSVSCSILKHNLPKALHILGEILTSTVFSEQEVRQILVQSAAQEKVKVMQNGHQAALSQLASYLTTAGVYQERLNGIFYCRAVNHVAAQFEGEAVLEKFRKLSEQIFTASACTVSLTGDESCLAAVQAAGVLPLPAGTAQSPCTVTPEIKNEGVIIPAGINYVAKGLNYQKEGLQYSGTLEVLGQILQYDYLWNQIRVKGGAYGTGFRVDRSTIAFWSYRDPNVGATLAAFDGAEEYLKKFAADEGTMTGYIIGTLANREKPFTPRISGKIADQRYFAGVTAEMRAQARREILGTTAKQIQDCAVLIGKMKEANVISVVGNAKAVEESGAFRTVAEL